MATETPIVETTTTTTITTWSTLHIFGYGETQLIGTDLNKKVPTSSLTTVQAVVDNVYSFKPEGNTATKEYHAINIFNDMFADWQTSQQGVEGWRVQYPELDATLIDALVAEIVAQPEPVNAKTEKTNI
jgi:hypothetical protein